MLIWFKEFDNSIIFGGQHWRLVPFPCPKQGSLNYLKSICERTDSADHNSWLYIIFDSSATNQPNSTHSTTRNLLKWNKNLRPLQIFLKIRLTKPWVTMSWRYFLFLFSFIFIDKFLGSVCSLQTSNCRRNQHWKAWNAWPQVNNNQN